MGWRERKERIFYEPVEKCTWTTVHHDDEVKSGRNILLIFTGYIVRACRYVAPIPEFFPTFFPLFSLSLSLSLFRFVRSKREHLYIPIHANAKLCVTQMKRDRKFEARVARHQSMNISSHRYIGGS